MNLKRIKVLTIILMDEVSFCSKVITKNLEIHAGFITT